MRKLLFSRPKEFYQCLTSLLYSSLTKVAVKPKTCCHSKYIHSRPVATSCSTFFFYRAFHGFGHAKFAHGGSIDSKIIISLRLSKSVKHSVLIHTL